MINRLYFNLLSTFIIKHWKKHISIFIISTILLTIFLSIFLTHSSLKADMNRVLDNAPSLIIQNMKVANRVDMPIEFIDELYSIDGIAKITPRVYGKYFFKETKEYFTIVGVNLFEEQTSQKLSNIIKDLDIKEFLSKDSMIIGEGVSKIFNKNYFRDNYIFRNQNSSYKVNIYKTIPKELNLISSNIVLMDNSLAKKILEIDENFCSDVVVDIANVNEIENIKNKIIMTPYNVRVLEKSFLINRFENILNFKSTTILAIYSLLLVTFMLLVYQKYSSLMSEDKKEIKVLKAVGWSIKDIILLKSLESFIVLFFAFLCAYLISFVYVYIYDAKLIQYIFLGNFNLNTIVKLKQEASGSTIFSAFMIFASIFTISIIYPIWKLASIDVGDRK